nr:glycosyltransferase [Microbacterium sp. ZXX196]
MAPGGVDLYGDGPVTTEPRVAVVVRTKDRPRFLARALSSITAQTLEDWECVIVNDGGGTAPVDEAIARVPERFRDRVRVLHRQRSHGRWVSANAGVLASTADLLVLHDDDDTWHPEFLERAVAYLDAPENADRAGVVSRIELVREEPDGDGFRVLERQLWEAQLPMPTLADELLYNRFVPIGFLYRRSAHERHGLYDEALPVIGDWDFYLKLLREAPLEYLDDTTPYAYWHQRPGQGGAHGNSVIAAGRDHRLHDARIRDEALRAYVRDNGDGLVLFLSKMIDDRIRESEERIIREVERYSLPERTVRTLKRLARRARGA